MDKDIIIKLINAGYSKEDIEAMESKEEVKEVEEVTEKVYNVDEENEAVKGDETAPNVSSINDDFKKALDEAKAELLKLSADIKNDLHDFNIKMTSYNGVEPTEVKVEDILGKIIAPSNNNQ